MSQDPVSIGRFQITGAIGRGAMGAIYKAHDPDIDRPVAIKLIRADLLESADRDAFIARFRREAQAAGRCSHPNIVALYDFALHEGNPYLAMEFIDGITLRQARPADGRFASADAIFVVLQVLAALQCAHAAGVVHRDIKPANILLVGGTQVKVADFGIARLNASDLTLHEGLVGTPSYMSPEQCRGATVDTRSDIFSLGIVMFEMLAGHKPFRGDNSAEVLAKIVMQETPNLRMVVPEAGDALCAVIEKCLAKLPEHRYASAQDVARALKAAAASSGTELDDRTIFAPAQPAAPTTGDPQGTRGSRGAAAPSQSLAATFDPQLLDTLSRKLAAWVGPIAPLLVQTAVRKATTVQDLCAELESKVERPADRLAFQHELKLQLGASLGQSHQAGTGNHGAQAGATVLPAGATTAVAPISAADIDMLQTRLARHLGPMARVLIKRAAPGATSLLALKQTLAMQIADERDRVAFLND